MGCLNTRQASAPQRSAAADGSGVPRNGPFLRPTGTSAIRQPRKLAFATTSAWANAPSDCTAMRSNVVTTGRDISVRRKR